MASLHETQGRAGPAGKVVAALRAAGLAGPSEEPAVEPLDGGVSSDIWRVAAAGRAYCVKRALPRLKVAARWEAPVERNHAEAEWMRVAAVIAPGAAPRLVHEDRAAGLIVMDYLDPAGYPLWKPLLRDGIVEQGFAAALGATIGRIHSATAGDPGIAGRFANDATFHAIRLEPYLLAAARAHPDLAPRLAALAETTAASRRALVHGDVSPKNILVGPDGPVFLDAECAWYGDPAFDVAFCLNHLLLKCLWRPIHRAAYLAAFRALADAWLACVDWEPGSQAEARAARLLPGLLLARVDGKSPVEYLTEPDDKARVRDVAGELLRDPPARLAAVAAAWAA